MQIIVKDIIELQTNFRLTISEMHRLFFEKRIYGVQKSTVTHEHYHLSWLLNKITEGNLSADLNAVVSCPCWLTEHELNSIIALIKRIIHEHQF